MLGPGQEWAVSPARFISDHFDGALPHLENHDVTLVAASRAPQVKSRPSTADGLAFPWVSASSDFFDYNVSLHPGSRERGVATCATIATCRLSEGFKDMELPGLSAFIKNESGEVFYLLVLHKGLEDMLGAMMLLTTTLPQRPQRNQAHGFAFAATTSTKLLQIMVVRLNA